MTDPLDRVPDLRPERPLNRSRFKLPGERRTEVTELLAEAYRADASVRDLSRKTGLAYSMVHALLKEANVEMRSRGGDTTKKRKETS